MKELHGIFARKPCDLEQELTYVICRTNLDASCLMWNSATLSAQVFLPAFVNAETSSRGRKYQDWQSLKYYNILPFTENLAYFWSRKHVRKRAKASCGDSQLEP